MTDPFHPHAPAGDDATRRLPRRRNLPHPRRPDQSTRELIQVVLDDGTVARLRVAAAAMEVEVEHLITRLLHAASYTVDDVLGSEGCTE